MAPALLPWLLLVATGLHGIDFGFHWDEDHHTGTVRTAIQRGVPLPGEYRYPSVSFWLALAGAMPEIIAGDAGDEEGRAAVLVAVGEKRVRLRTRTLFLLVSSLAALWVHAAVWVWRRRAVEALAAAAVLALSWEVAYHLRWIAPDGVLMMFAAATLAACCSAVARPARRLALPLAAVCAGLACGTKWPAGLLLAPVLLAAWQARPPAASPGAHAPRSTAAALRALAPRLAGLVAIFAATYLVTTPGTLLEARTFLDSVRLQQGVYSRGHLGHTVSGPFDHLGRVLEYFALAFGSRFALLSLAVFAAFAGGVAALVRESRSRALLVLVFPVLYLAFFAFFPVMIVRNYLVLAPFFALLTARGLVAAADALRAGAAGPWGARALLGLASLVAVANGAWLVWASDSVVRFRDRAPIAPAARYLDAQLDAHPDARFAVSASVRQRLAALDGRSRPNLIDGPLDDARAAVFHASESYAAILGATPRHDLTSTWFGPFEVNFNYYPSWLGADRIVVMPVEHYPRRRFLRPEHMPPGLRPGANQDP